MQRIAKWLNRSPRINRLLTFFSVLLARYRGAPILVGLVLVVVSFVLHLLAVITDLTGWYVLAFTVLHIGLFLGLLGVLLAEPLGKG